ncbi:MAG TPA: hypothetical protein PL023_11945 [Thiobacillus sp.]|nr:hypothetical protein [Thiobacillus sp.]
MNLVISIRAQRDIRDATAWYEEQAQGLSTEFLRAVELNLGYVLRNPGLFAEVLPSIRRIGLRRFPYNLFYRVRDEKNYRASLPAPTSRPAGLAATLRLKVQRNKNG